MTEEKAIEILKKNKPTSDPRQCGKELCEAVDIAINVLEKQIRKKPDETMITRYLETTCPNCHEVLRTPYSLHCGDCGQALDFGE